MRKAQHVIGIDLLKTVIQVCVLTKAGEIDEEFRPRLDEAEAETRVLQRLRRWKTNGQFVCGGDPRLESLVRQCLSGVGAAHHRGQSRDPQSQAVGQEDRST